MLVNDISSPRYWAARFGLALTPLFETHKARFSGEHSVLLGGGVGSFALSVCTDRIWKDRNTADWSWSSNLPHHVTVTDREVAVVRWDKEEPEILTRSSVEGRLDRFYEHLAADRVHSNHSVTEHMLTVFRRVRSLVRDAHLNDDQSIDAFLAFLRLAIRQSNSTVELEGREVPTHSEGDDLLQTLSSSGVNNLLEYVRDRSSTGMHLLLIPSLAVRHAGSEIFQEAHFELLRATSPDLFGYVAPSEGKPVTRGGTHYTPPALAQTIVEQALAQVGNLADLKRLAILDPACGSGSFLYEALRTLRRCNYRGRLFLYGRDTSRPAISMAGFVLRAAIEDWSPMGGCDIDIRQSDSLDDRLPAADVVLMNPPFVAWSALTTEQRQQMSDILGSDLQGRGDLSMAFVTRAIDSLAPGGVLGTLLPASVLTLWAAEKWRRTLLDETDLTFIASLGDYGLFRYAQVQVAAAVFARRRPDRKRIESVEVLVATNDSGATGDALRTLRRIKRLPVGQVLGKKSWRLFRTPLGSLQRRTTWRLTSPTTEEALGRLMGLGGVVRIGDLFHVRQGVRTGLKRVFVLPTWKVDELPEKERPWFRPAIMNESISDAQIETGYRVFYPYDEHGLAIRSEADLLDLVPVYVERYLQPMRSQLKERASLVRAKRRDWWGLSRRRAWAGDHCPRIVSKYFGGPGGFAMDLEGRYIVVQGFAWLPKWQSTSKGLPIPDVLAAYAAVLNSTGFARLLEIFSPHVAGGQFDLSARHVARIPVPDLSTLSGDERTGRLVTRLARLGSRPQFADPEWRGSTDAITRDLFGGDVFNRV